MGVEFHKKFRRGFAVTVFLFSWPAFSQDLVSLYEEANQKDWSLHGQVTTVTQGISQTNSPYSGTNSVGINPEVKTSETATLFLGHTLWSGANLIVNPEVAGGSGLAATHGVAGFPNGEIYRVDDPSPKFNLSRLYVRQVFGLGGETEEIENDINQMHQTVDVRRVTLVAGKFALNDFLDDNTFSHDPRNQFLNWSLMDNGAWDYAADTRGYSWGYMLEYNQPQWAIRISMVLVPESANGMAMDTNLLQAHGDNAEFEYRYRILQKKGKARLLGYMNHAHMGNYQATLDNPAYGMDITQTRSYSTKYGFGLNLEQEVVRDVGAFVRLGWNDGQTESWTFTEVDRTLSSGLSLNGNLWGMRRDVAGIALIVNGLSKEHADYLSSGGYGFMLGDGRLNYAPEQIAELYYLFRPMNALGITADFQMVNNPGYNQDRGPATIIATRMHVEI